MSRFAELLEQAKMGFRQIDPLILLSAVVSLFVALETDPWWRVSGATSNKLFTMEVSPYYFQTIARHFFRSALRRFSGILNPPSIDPRVRCPGSFEYPT